MAKVKIKNVQAVRKLVGSRFKIAINKLLRSKDIRSKVGRIIVDDIQSINWGTASEKYQAFRDRIKNPKDKKYAPPKINITITGKLLNDLITNVKANTTKLELIIEHSEKKHPKYKLTSSGRKRKATPSSTYKEIGEGISRYYDYLTISDKASKKITRLIQDELFNLLK